MKLLEKIAADVAAVRALLEAAPAPLRDANAAALVTAIARIFGDAAFSAAELVERAASPEGADLAATIGTASARRVGKRLRRIDGVDLGGARVERIGAGRDGAIWQVRVCGSGNSQTRAPSSRVEVMAGRSASTSLKDRRR